MRHNLLDGASNRLVFDLIDHIHNILIYIFFKVCSIHKSGHIDHPLLEVLYPSLWLAKCFKTEACDMIRRPFSRTATSNSASPIFNFPSFADTGNKAFSFLRQQPFLRILFFALLSFLPRVPYRLWPSH